MRKSVLHRSSVFSAIILFAVLAFVSCIKDEKVKLVDTTGNLSLIPELFDDGVDYLKGHTKARSKAKNDEDPNIVQGDDVIARSILNENLIETLDIFIKKESDGESTPWIYVKHLDKDQTGIILDPNSPGGLMDKAKQLINKNWANELTLEGTPFDPDIQYHIYVTANNPHTHSCSHTSHNHYKYRVEGSTIPASLADLRELHTYDAKTDCYYTPDEVPARTNRVNHKAFLMDGDIVWSPEPELGEQVWDVDLKRAVSKILVTLGMDPDFKEEISHKANGKNWTSGQPMWRYVHFGFDVADIASGTYELDKDQTGSPYDNKPFKTGALCNTDEVDASQWQWYVKTYTAPFKWSDYTDSPYLLVSVRYTFTPENPEDTLMIGTKIYHYNDQRMCYYRIPICNEQQVADKGLQRNNIYIVDAKIASWGSENEEFEAEDFYLDLEYHVVPWTETNVDHESTIIHLGDINYLTVHPQQYILKGDGAQAVDLNWYASVATDDGRFPDIDVSSLKVSYVNYLGNEVNIKGTVTKEPASPDGLGNIVITSTAPDNNASRGETVQIILTTDGLIKVSSQALLSRAVKTIEFDVELKTTTLPKKHVVIKHFPLDNIQSITGSWSSRWDGVNTNTEYSFNPTADGWTSWDGYEDNVECTQAEYNSASDGKSIQSVPEPTGTPSDYDSYSETETGGDNSTMQRNFRNAVPQNSRQNANSEATAYHRGDYWYWGTGQTRLNNGNQGYDWTGNNNRRYYRFNNYYRRIYYKNITHYYARRYYRTVESWTPGTGNWVDWKNHTGTVWSQGIYTAKVWNGTYCCGMTSANSFTTNNYTNLTNNHMYVIQITSASNEYAVGKPVVDGNYQSQDHVVSPAFMIASQLGAVTRTESPTTAATHCGTYMEVGTDGTRYVGWRLPTKEEINVIIGYQNGIYTHNVTMVEVLGGAYYWTLDGTSANVPTGDEGTATNAYVRCVRDLSLSEISKLNNGE